ncbi:MAG: [ribosomal protein S5]-alanine N-acetyltransferase [Frankiales bacterium]|nr:[ribosomal protein S5]-alanine N-acetyltransferase [Frankiales bacterium]
MITLAPVPLELAQAVLSYAEVDVPHAGDWPHADTYDALRPFAEHGGGPGTFLVLEDGVIVGDCGWFGPPDADSEVEIGYGLAPSARGRGLGTEAVRLLVEWILGQGARSVRAEVLPGNETSLRLLARLGFEDTGERAGHRILVRA